MSAAPIYKTYETPISGQRLTIFLVLGGIALLFNLSATLIESLRNDAAQFEDYFFLGLSILLLAFGVYALIERSTLKLITSETGIEYHQLWARFFIPWEDFDFLETGRVSGRGGGPYAFLHLTQPAQRLSPYGWPGSDNRTRLDVSPFYYQLLEGDLAETLQHHAPHVHIPHPKEN